MRLLRLEVHSFRSLRNVTLDLSTGSPCVVMGSNAAGKSSLMEALEWSLTGALRPGSRATDVLPWSGGGVFVSSTWVDGSGGVYEVRRYRKHPGRKDGVYVYVGDAEWEETKGSTNTDKTKTVLSLFGTPSVLDLMILRQKDSGILSLSGKALYSMVQSVTRTDVYDTMHKLAKQDHRQQRRNRDSSQRVVDEVKMSLDRLQDAHTAPSDKGGRTSGHTSRSLHLLLTQVQAIAAHYKAKRDSTQRALQTVEAKLETTRHTIQECRAELSGLDGGLAKGTCPLCQRGVSEEEKGPLLTRRSYVLGMLDEYVEARDKLAQKAMDGRRKFRELSEIDGSLRKRYQLIATRLQRSRSTDKKPIADLLTQTRNRLREVRQERDTHQWEMFMSDYWATWAKEKSVQEQIQFFATVSQDVNQTLTDLWPDFPYEVTLGNKTDAKGAPSPGELTWIVSDPRGEGTGVCLSGGQEVRVNLVVQSCLLRSLGVYTLVLDEWFRYLDEDGVRGAWDLIQSLSREGMSIILVTHQNQWVDATHLIEKEGDVSTCLEL